MGLYFPFGLFDAVFPLLFTLVFFCIIGVFIVMLAQNIGEWNRNNHSPRLTVDAVMVTKRTEVSHHSHVHNTGTDGAAHFQNTTSTAHYATFQVESGDRMEFSVTGREYGMLVEGDRGRLTFQGSRYLGFERT